MKLFGLNLGGGRRAAAASAGGAVHKNFGDAVDWVRGGETATVFANAYQQVVWVYRAINVLAEQVANVPFLFSFGERGRENLVMGGPLSEFYGRPHPQIDRFQYWELRIIWLMLRGECFRLPVFEANQPGQGRRLSRVLILDPTHFQHLVEDHRLVGWRYTGFGPRAPLASQVFLPEEVWFEKLPNPFDFWRGLAPLHAAATAARTDFAAANFMRGIIENNADSGVIVRTDQPLDPEQQEQLFAALRERKRKAGTADRPVLLSGCSEVIKPQLSSTDLQFLENRKFSRAEICAAFGVPEEIVTTTDSAKYDVMRGARLNFIENRVAPLCGRLEASEQMTVRSLEPRAVGWFDLDSLPILQEARRARLVAARTGFDMGIPFNELNRVLDLGFRALPWGDAGYLSARLQRLGETRPANKPASNALKTPGDPGTWQNRLRSLLAEAGRGEPTTADPVLKRRGGRLRRYLFEQRGRALARCDEGRPADGQPGSRLALERENEALAALVKPWLREDFGCAAASALAEAGLAASELPSAAIEDFLSDQEASIRELNWATSERLNHRADPSAGTADHIRACYNEMAAAGVERFLTELRHVAHSAGRAAAIAFIGTSARTAQVT